MKDFRSETDFASPERQDEHTINRQYEKIVSQPFMQEVLNSLPYAALLLNEKRQVVFSNTSLIEMLEVSGPDEYLGLRPGEIFQCIHAGRRSAGCGTSTHCRVCGAVQVFLSSQKEHRKVSGECRITTVRNGGQVCYDLRVTSTPLLVDESRFFILNMIDISHEKRRRLLERVFFHDIMNSAGNIVVISELASRKPEKRDEMIPLLLRTSEQLIDDINAQKKLLDAENNELVPHFENVGSMECLEFTLRTFHEFAADRSVKMQLDPASEDVLFESDKSLLLRVLGNMLKNAVEATSEKKAVTIGCKRGDGTVLFWCHNPHYMPEDIQMQVYQRSFTTKGTGRGLGTYIIKLFSERYLGGKAGFSSSEQEGTTFTVTLPVLREKPLSLSRHPRGI